MNLSNQQIKRLRATTHQLKPVVMIGQNGLTEAVQKEIEIAIEYHELIKLRIPSLLQYEMSLNEVCDSNMK